MSTELATVQQEPSIGLMLQAVIQNGVTEQNVSAMEKLCDLYERNEARKAEQTYAIAMHALQSELPVIVAKSIIPNRGKYERFEDIMEVVGPLLRKHGFSVKFANDYADNRIKETCTIAHIGGHKESNSFTVRVGAQGDSDTQKDCKAATTAKRNALLNALNIVIRQDVLQSDDDPRNESDARVTQHQADELRDLCDAVSADKKKFLAFANAETFEGIAAARFDELVNVLNKKAKR